MKTRISPSAQRSSFRLPRAYSASLALLATGLFAACGSSGPSSKLAVGPVTFTGVDGTARKALTELTQGRSTYLEVGVTGDPQLLGANWSVYCGSALPPGTPPPAGDAQDDSCGTFVPGHTTSTPIPSYATNSSPYIALYTAPDTPPAHGTVTLYASSTTDPSRFSSATLTILGQSIGVQFDPAPPATVAVGASVQFTAVVANDPSNAGVTWTVTCQNPVSEGCGAFSPTTTASGASTTYTAPSFSDGLGAEITVTSVADPTKSVTAAIAIPAAN